MKRRRIVISLTVLAIVVLGIYGIGRHLAGASLEIRNESDDVLHDLRIKVWTHTFELGDLEPGCAKTIKIRDYSDNSWSLTAGLEGREDLELDIGYITNGMNSRDEITIREDLSVRHSQDVGWIFGTLY